MSVLSAWAEWIPELLPGLLVSIEITMLSLIFGLPAGVLLALGVISTSRMVRALSLGVVELGRGIPALVLLYLIYFGFPRIDLTMSAFVSAVLALATSTGAYTSEIFRAGIGAVPHGQIEASDALGLGFATRLRRVVLPQAIRHVIPPLIGWSIILFQGTSLAYAIGVSELTSRAYNIGTVTFRFWDVLILAGLMYAVICIPISQLVGWMQRRSAFSR